MRSSLGILPDNSARAPRTRSDDRDPIALGIAAAAVIMFVGTGSAVVPKVIAAIAGSGAAPDNMLVNALLLNVALIIFGWRRHRQLSDEIAERRRAEEQARLLAETDPLTGYLNRRSFGRAIEMQIRSAADCDQSTAIMMIDLDKFKQVNDLNGHAVGDRVLVQCASRIASVLPSGSLLARMGGDEFACSVAYDRTCAGTVDTIAADIVRAISQPGKIAGCTLNMSASLGIASTDALTHPNPDTHDAQHLLDMADVAMYHAKRQGRNTYCWFEEHMADEMRLRANLETAIREGLSKGEFEPYYEQQIDVRTGRLTGFEMLARWNSPEFGLLKPDIFIPVAEEIGVISDLSEHLIARALSDARQWPADLTLAVNISPVQLRDAWFSQRLLKLLTEANFPPSRLEIEITESCVHENITLVRNLIASLKNQGIRVSIDDFGTGYSSLAQLRSLPFDRIKIDRSFVTNLADNADSAAIVESIAMLGKGLGLPITAEGIENPAILEHLQAYGDIKGQGYLYGHPRSAVETQTWLSERTGDHRARDICEAARADIADTPDEPRQDLRMTGSL